MREPTFAGALAAILARDGLPGALVYAANDAAAVLPRWRRLPTAEAARHADAAAILANLPGVALALPRRLGAPWPGEGVPVELALRVESGEEVGAGEVGDLVADLLHLLAESTAADLARAAADGLALDPAHAAALLEAAAAGERIRGELARRRTGG